MLNIKHGKITMLINCWCLFKFDQWDYSLCAKINNVLCYFSKRDPLVKLKLLRSYCSDFYGRVLWDLAHSSVEDVCIAWRKGLKRVWGLPTRTHSVLVAPLCGLLHLRTELVSRCAGFVVKCLNSSNQVVKSVARHGVYFQFSVYFYFPTCWL